MQRIMLKGRKCSGGRVQGEALVAHQDAVSLLSDVSRSGIVQTPRHELHGKEIAGKILVFPTGRGSTAEPWGAYWLMKVGKAPGGIINVRANPTTVAGAIISGIPMMHKLDQNPVEVIETGDMVTIDADNGIVEVVKKDTA